ncbi:hypothetical protein AKJ09_10124 [Labilithrix luteola]|uniref:Uncharacterized protein n=1 Tax=Labilithrix luteola TaxID=1391654 RepID=A0A0K1QCF5_9BACT|nr:hypothetical protein AKJ09_10124 [Labilithrix luteola]
MTRRHCKASATARANRAQIVGKTRCPSFVGFMASDRPEGP